MKRLFLVLALFSFLNANYFAGIKLANGVGSLSVSKSEGEGTCTYSEDTTTTDFQLYVGKDKFFLFYQMGTITPTTSDFDDYRYKALGIGYYHLFDAKWYLSKIEFQPQFMGGMGYDYISGSGNGKYNSDKNGLLIPLSLGMNIKPDFFKKVKLLTEFWYDMHFVRDTEKTGNRDWSFDSLKLVIGLKFEF